MIKLIFKSSYPIEIRVKKKSLHNRIWGPLEIKPIHISFSLAIKLEIPNKKKKYLFTSTFCSFSKKLTKLNKYGYVFNNGVLFGSPTLPVRDKLMNKRKL